MQILIISYHFGVKTMENTNHSHLEEKKRHGDVLFPFNIYPCTIPGDFPSVALHWHRNMEIVLVKKGSLLCQLDMHSTVVSQGDICIAPPGTLHGLRAREGITAEYENIIFDPELLGLNAADLCARQYLLPLSAGKLISPRILRPGDAGYDGIAGELARAEQLCGDRPEGFELAVKAVMLMFIFRLMQLQIDLPAAERNETARLKQVLAFIQQEYARPITVEQAAIACGLSASHFMRWFKQSTGSSFISYLNEYRLSQAAHRLRGTEEKILTIAQDAGFETLSNFNHQFKLRYGQTPRDYRNGKSMPNVIENGRFGL